MSRCEREPRLAFGVNRGVADNVVQAPRFDNRACARSGRGSLLPVALTAFDAVLSSSCGTTT